MGQSRDYTAIAVVERAELKGDWDPFVVAWRKKVELHLRFLERVDLGTPYQEIVERVVEVTQAAALVKGCHVAVDATGVGRAVVDLLRDAEPRGRLMPVIFTAGALETQDRGYFHVPKRDLVVGLQVLLQKKELRISSRIRDVATLLKELSDMQVRVTLSGNEQYGAWREGTHDDLVFAVALACWSAKKVHPPLQGDARWWRPLTEDTRGW